MFGPWTNKILNGMTSQICECPKGRPAANEKSNAPARAQRYANSMDAPVLNDSDDPIVAFARYLTEPGADLGLRLPEAEGDARERALRAALNATAERIAKDLRELALIANASSTKIAQTASFSTVSERRPKKKPIWSTTRLPAWARRSSTCVK